MDELGKAGELIRTVGTKITSSLTSTLDQCEQCLSTCQSNIEGHGHDTMAAIQQKLDKINRKIDDYLIVKLATCYNLLSRFGVPYLTDEELHQGPGAEGRPSQGPGGQQQPQVSGSAAQTQTSASGQPQNYGGGLEQLGAQPKRPLAQNVAELNRPYPKPYKKGDDCCEWWILWWEWFQPYFWHWFHGWLKGDCIPVALCIPDKADDTPPPITVPLLTPALPFWVEREVGLPVADYSIEGE